MNTNRFCMLDGIKRKTRMTTIFFRKYSLYMSLLLIFTKSEMEEKKDRSYVYLIVAAALILFDQITKISVKGFNLICLHHQGMEIGDGIPIIGDIVRFVFVENPGMAFGISFGAGKIFLSLFSILASIGLIVLILRMKTENPWVRFAFTLILAGAAGNMIDRVFYGVFYGESPLFFGMVVDFIQVDIPDIDFLGAHYTHFPVFNVADSCVTCGVILLLLFYKKNT